MKGMRGVIKTSWVIEAGSAGRPNLYGPFATPAEAAAWADKNLVGGIWSIRKMSK